MYTDITRKIQRQRIHLKSTRDSLIAQIKLENQIIIFVEDSEKKLNDALQIENIPSQYIDSLRVKLANDLPKPL